MPAYPTLKPPHPRPLFCLLAMLTGYLLSPAYLAGSEGGGDLMEILPVTDQILMLHIRDGHIATYGAGQTVQDNVIYHDPTDLSNAVNPSNYLLTSPDDPQYAEGRIPLYIGRKSKGAEYQGEGLIPPYIWQHWVYLQWPYALQQGKSYTLRLYNITGNRDTYSFVFDVNRLRSETVRVNMVGFPKYGPKIAYLSHWMGDFHSPEHPEGALHLDDKTDAEFRVIEYTTGKTVYSGKIHKRFDKTQVETTSGDFPSGNYTMAGVWECDFSALTRPGEYVVAVDGIGRSFPFEIGQNITREIFHYAMKGLFWQRQGIVKEVEPGEVKPRGHHPDDIIWRFDKNFVSDTGYAREVVDFNRDAPRVQGIWGHYYDAGDWDGYTHHNPISGQLMLLYELAPHGFHDGDANHRYKLEAGGEWIEEGRNGLADLLDEAGWLLNYNRRARHILKNYGTTGGVPGFVGRDAIPYSNTITAWMDTRDWFVSGENLRATYLYAGNAAYYSLVLDLWSQTQGLGKTHPDSAGWMREALESWTWAQSRVVTTENERRAMGFAAAALYRATGDTSYQEIFADYWEWEPGKGTPEMYGILLWDITAAIYALADPDHPGLDTDLWNECRNYFIQLGKNHVEDIKNNAFRSGIRRSQHMFLGAFTTPRVTSLAVSHFLTGEAKYLEAIQHAVSYALGGNQLNMTYLSGLGERSDQWIFQPNAYLINNTNHPVYSPENYIGQTSYFGGTGLASRFWQGKGRWKWSEFFSRIAAYPPVSENPGSWPGSEQKFHNRYSIQGGEFTVHQQPNFWIFAAGYLNAMVEGNTEPFILASRPQAKLLLPEGYEFPLSGGYLLVSATENTRRVDYYRDWRYLGSSQDAADGFRFRWEPRLPEGTEVLITAVAFSDRGRQSRPSPEGEARLRLVRESLQEE